MIHDSGFDSSGLPPNFFDAAEGNMMEFLLGECGSNRGLSAYNATQPRAGIIPPKMSVLARLMLDDSGEACLELSGQKPSVPLPEP